MEHGLANVLDRITLKKRTELNNLRFRWHTFSSIIHGVHI